MEISGSAALVTGGASGLGRATAQLLVERGAKVFIADRDTARGKKVCTEIGADFIEMNVADDPSVQAGLNQVASIGPLRAVVNCAGVPGRTPTSSGRILDAASATPLGADLVNEQLTINLTGTFHVVRWSASVMARQTDTSSGKGVIILVGSISAIDGMPGQAVYAASKAGVIGATLPLARDLSEYGIRVMTIAPGLFDTPILGNLPGRNAAMGRNIPWPTRAGNPREFGELACHIISNDYLNGEVIRLDGALRTPFTPWQSG